MSFRKLRGVKLTEEQQGLVRYICLNEEYLPVRMREKIQRLCDAVGGAYADALWEAMCTKRSITAIAMDHYTSESTLYRLRKEFYECWYLGTSRATRKAV